MFQTYILINCGIYYSVPAAAANYTEYSVPIFFLYCLQRLSTLHYYNSVLLKFLPFIFFVSWSYVHPLGQSRKKRNDSKLSIPATLRASIKNTDPKLIKLTMQNIRLKDKVSRIGIKKIKFDIGSKFNHFKDDSLSSDLYFFQNLKINSPPFMKYFVTNNKSIFLLKKSVLSYTDYTNCFTLTASLALFIII